MKIKRKRWKNVAAAMLLLCVVLTGCGMSGERNIKLRDLDFTVLSEEKIPEELKTVIAEKGSEPFRLTYSDNQNLYISIGYGEQKTGGYSIAVDELYLTDDAVHVSTSLLGPDITGQKSGAGKPTTPYIVIKTELLDKTVIYN
ncbi:MAG: protease complex subunit PrcB family protein [Acetatifactor sp.]|nr:protease complex subunit PrcB family protein [Acetatifactor sp.]